MTFWGGSGSGSSGPSFWLMAPDPDPAIFVIDLQDASKKLILTQFFLLITFWKYIYIIFQRYKSQKVSQNRRNQGFSYYFCMMIEGSGFGSIPLTSGSGSGRPKNRWVGSGSGSGTVVPVMSFFFVVDPDPHWFGCPGSGSLMGLRTLLFILSLFSFPAKFLVISSAAARTPIAVSSSCQHSAVILGKEGF